MTFPTRWPDAPPSARPPVEVESLLDELDKTDAFELAERILRLQRVRAGLDAQMGRLLWFFESRALWEWSGQPSMPSYVEERLGMSTSRARQLIRVQRHFWWSDSVMERYQRGGISALALDVIRSVADDRRADAWVERAGEVTLERLHKEVEWAQVQEELTGRRPDPPELGAELPTVSEQVSAHPPAERKSVQQTLRLCLPESIAELFFAAVEHMAHPGDRPWQVLERMGRAALAEWKRQPAHRNPTFRDYDFRCALPGCTERRNLQEHHVLFRSRGGGNERSNRISLCWWHHQRGIHGGIVRVTGTGPSHLRWDVGCRNDRPSRAVLQGEVFV